MFWFLPRELHGFGPARRTPLPFVKDDISQPCTPNAQKSKEALDKAIKCLETLVNEVRAETAHVSEPKASALLETTAALLIGLTKAHKDYESGEEDAWK